MHPDQHVMSVVLRPGDIAAHQGDVLNLVVDIGVADGPELAVPGRDAGLGDSFDVLLVLPPPLDQVGNGDQGETMLVGEDPQLIGLRHGALIFLADDFADRAGRLKARHPGQVDGRFGVAWATQDTAVLGAQRNHVARFGEVIDDARRIRQQSHCGGPIRC